MGDDEDEQLRTAAFARVRTLAALFGDSIPWGAIEEGFLFSGTRVFLSGRARGIFRPRQMRRGVLSIKTTVPRHGRQRRYDDIASDEGFFEYRFMGEDPDSADNQALREAMEDRSPLIYFHAVAPSVYQAIWPAFITAWDPAGLSVRVVPGEVLRGEALLPASTDARRYVAVAARRRLHQAMFRELVLDAYQGRCALSGLPERRLLQAAHILPDRDERGLPIVGNGIAMTALHHAAYDANLLGIDAEGRIHVNRELLAIHDGPTLEYALKGVHGTRMRLPLSPAQEPDPEFLAARFEQFTKTA